LINEKKHAIKTAHADGLEKADDIGKDLLSILSASPVSKLVYRSSSVRANMATDLKPDQRMSDDEVMAQITTFVSLPAERWDSVLTERCWLVTKLHPPL